MKSPVSVALVVLMLSCCSHSAVCQQPQQKTKAPELTSDDITPSRTDPRASEPPSKPNVTSDPITAAWNEAIDRLNTVKSYRVRDTGYWGHKTPVTLVDTEIVLPDSYHVVMPHAEQIVVSGVSFNRSKAPDTPWVQTMDPRKPWLAYIWYYQDVKSVKFIGEQSLNGMPVRVYDGFNSFKRVRIRMFVAVSDGLPRRVEFTDSQDGSLVFIHSYSDYNKDIVIQAP
jgi:hypothetical protein